MRALPTTILALSAGAIVENETGNFWFGLLAAAGVVVVMFLIAARAGRI